MRQTRGATRPRLVVLVVAGLVLALALLRLVPPVAAWLLAPVVLAGELAPYVALAAAGVAVWALAARPRHVGAAALALAAFGVALVPGVQARAAARAAAASIARMPAGDGEPRPSPAADRGTEPGAIEERPVRYAAADGTPLTLRLFRPAGAGTHPTLAVLYGGAWRSNDATQAAGLHRRLAARGYTVVALDYRHAPAHRYPAQLDDVRRGLALLGDSAAAWGANPSRLVLWGRSSGAHLAMLAAWTAPGSPATSPAPPVRGVIAFYGPVDLADGYAHPPRPDPLDVRRVLRQFLGGTPAAIPARYREASPIVHVRPGLPPTLIVYGGRDHLVEARFGRRVAAALARAGSPVVDVELPWAEHGFDFVPGGVGARVAHGAVDRFLARVM